MSGAGSDYSGVQAGGHCHDFEGGAGIVDQRDGRVDEVLVDFDVVRQARSVECGTIGETKDVAVARVDDQDGAGTRAETDEGCLEFLFGDALNGAVHGEHQGGAVDRRQRVVFSDRYGPAAGILVGDDATRATAEFLVIEGLDPVVAGAEAVDEADEVGAEIVARIDATGDGLEAEAADCASSHRLSNHRAVFRFEIIRHHCVGDGRIADFFHDRIRVKPEV